MIRLYKILLKCHIEEGMVEFSELFGHEICHRHLLPAEWGREVQLELSVSSYFSCQKEEKIESHPQDVKFLKIFIFCLYYFLFFAFISFLCFYIILPTLLGFLDVFLKVSLDMRALLYL